MIKLSADTKQWLSQLVGIRRWGVFVALTVSFDRKIEGFLVEKQLLVIKLALDLLIILTHSWLSGKKQPMKKNNLLCNGLAQLQREKHNDCLYDQKTSLFHGYAVKYIHKELERLYTSSFKKYPQNEIRQLVSNILHYAVGRKMIKKRRNYWDSIFQAMQNKNHLLPGNSPSDGSKHYAHSYRDNGEFGSFPTHDDYSEEGDL